MSLRINTPARGALNCGSAPENGRPGALSPDLDAGGRSRGRAATGLLTISRQAAIR